jgi:glycerol-3-phosphate dehydrogenase
MRRIQTEVLVIGGGATGTGVLRDAAMRGFDTVLVEQRDLSHGTTGRYHGLLHSGGRYVVKDPEAAVECIEENRVLRRIMPHCIEDTSGFFVVTPWDDEDYVSKFLEGCDAAGIPVAEVAVAEALRREPYLNPRISHCFEVPDAAADSFVAAESTVASATEHGGRAFPYHEVKTLVREGDRVVGARCLDLVAGEEVEIAADMVVNASGAWAGRLADTAGVTFEMRAGKGTMLAVNHRMINTVVNRCKVPDDGDIIVPIRTVAVIGTTDKGVPDPERFSVEPWEVQRMLEEGDKLVPGISGMRVLRAWAGVRPLYQEEATEDTRDVTRAYALLDHTTRDGVDGFLTITGGKWTSFRQMAEVTVDAVCRKLSVERECRTHIEPLPDRRNRGGHHFLGERLARVERDQEYGDLVCECELATRDDVTSAIVDGDARTIDDIRREVRVGMGPCQGGWCLPRVAGMLHELRRPPVSEVNVALRDFLRERWKGTLPIVWGSQLRQARLDQLIFTSLLNVPSLPGPTSSPLSPVMYEAPIDDTVIRTVPMEPQRATTSVFGSDSDVLVVGGGMAGLVAAWQAATAGAKTTLVTKGWGSLLWHAGTVDVLARDHSEVDQLATALSDLVVRRPHHPYALVGTRMVSTAVAELTRLARDSGYPMAGSLTENMVLPTALGAGRRTCLAPVSMTAGDLRHPEPMLIVGFSRFGDLHPDLVAANLAALGVPARGVTLDIPAVTERRFVNGAVLAGLFDGPAFRRAVAAAIGDVSEPRVGFPAVLGLRDAPTVVEDLAELVGAEVFEIPTLPISVPGLRLQTVLREAISRNGGRIVDNADAVALEASEGSRVVITTAAARTARHRARCVVLATGGLLGGGIVGAADGTLTEVVAGLKVAGPTTRSGWFSPEPGADDHPLFRAGVRTDADLRPLSGADGLFVAGGLLGGTDPLKEGSLEGIALATGYVAGRNAVEEALA